MHFTTFATDNRPFFPCSKKITILKKFKLFRQKSTEIKNYEPTKDDPSPQRKPSLVITPDSPDYDHSDDDEIASENVFVN